MKYSTSVNRQLELNLKAIEFAFAQSRTTTNLRKLIEALTGEKLTARDILQRGKQGRFELPSQTV